MPLIRLETLEVRRLLASVAPDLSFGINGSVLPPPDGAVSQGTTVTYLGRSGDGFLVSKFTYDRERRVESIEKLTNAGTRDRSYAAPVLADTVGQFVYVTEAVDRQGRALAVRSGGDTLTLGRYRTDGTPDPTFGDNGTTALTLPRPTGGVFTGFAGTYAERTYVAVNADGSFYVGVEAYGFNRKRQQYSSNGELLVVRFAADGRRDASYGSDQGYLRLGNIETDYFAAAPDGGLLVGSSVKTVRYSLAKYTTAGVADAAFGTGGVVRLVRDDNGGKLYLSSFGVTQDAGGRILVARSAPTPTLVRLTAAGRYDSTFGTGGVANLRGPANAKIDGVLPQADGKIALLIDTAPDRNDAGGTDDTYLQRLNADGTADTSLDGDGRTDVVFGNGRNVLIDRLADGGYLTAQTTADYSSGDNIQKLAAFSGVRLSAVGQLFVAETTKNAADRVTVTRLGNGGTRVTANGVVTDFAAGAVRSIYADLGNGDNAFDSAAIAVPTTLIGGLGSDTLSTGDGDDTVRGYDLDEDFDADDSAAHDVITTRGGVDDIIVGRAAYTIDSGPGGGAITNTLNGTNGTNGNSGTVVGGRGNWRVDLRGSTVDLTLAGKSQRGIVVFAKRANIDLGGFFGDVKVEFFGDASRITTGSGNDVVIGGTADDTIATGDGNDQIFSGSGNDVILAGRGDDRVSGDTDYRNQGGTGANDSVDLGPGNDSAVDRTGDNTISGGEGDDTITTGTGRDRLSGGDGRDRIDAGPNSDRLSGEGGRDTLNGGSGNDALSGGGNGDLLIGGFGNDILRGGPGDDRLYARIPGDGLYPAPRNTLDGESGNDTAFRESEDDTLVSVESTR